MGQPTPFSVEIVRIGTTDIIKLRGEIDISTAPKFEEKLMSLGSTLVLDFRELDFIDSSGLHVLIRRTQLKDGTELRIIMEPGIVAKVFRTTGLDQVFKTYPDLETALGDGQQGSRDE